MILKTIKQVGGNEMIKNVKKQLKVDFLPSLTAFIGYRRLRFDMKDTGKHNIDKSFHLGMRYSF